MRSLGCFVSVAGGLQNAVANGTELGVNTIMIHPSPPQRWCTKSFPEDQIAAFNEARTNSKIEHVYLHGIYLINLAKPDKQQFHLSKLSLVYYLELCQKIKADGVVFHVGSFKDTTEKEGFDRICYGLNWIFKEMPNDSVLLLESAAGAGRVVGATFEDLATIYQGVDDKKRIGYCLDTQHMYASGYDIVNKLDEVVAGADKLLGLDMIKAIHFNDSKVPFNSKRDRHENLGAGTIGKDGMTGFLNHPKLKDKSFILETPGLKEKETAKQEVDKLLSWAR